MSPSTTLALRGHNADPSTEIIKIAVMAVGGQGGGVLSNWIADLATNSGYAVQATSVAGVAQRTGATIYYIEMAKASVEFPTLEPVFALSPSAGDVDVVIAAELMEAGRAITRGFVTADRTTLIASTHRVLSISEKEVPGDGRTDAKAVERRFDAAAHSALCYDMQVIAEENGSMISSSLFGALARSCALPFATEAFEAVIASSGRGVDASLAAFRASVDFSLAQPSPTTDSGSNASKEFTVSGPEQEVALWQELRQRIQSLPTQIQAMATAGLRKVVDYQDINYGREYLTHVTRFIDRDREDRDYRLSAMAAKYLANALCYDDILRVADLKTRSRREARVRQEQQAQPGQIMHVTEYFHPRAEEFCATLPARLGAWIEQHPRAFALAQRLLDRGRRIRTDSVFGFGMLWLVAGLRPYRRALLRHRHEQEHVLALIDMALQALERDYELSVELLQCQRLIKGYSDTHHRSQSKFTRVTSRAMQELAQPDTAGRVAQWRKAALSDEHGDALDVLLSAR